MKNDIEAGGPVWNAHRPKPHPTPAGHRDSLFANLDFGKLINPPGRETPGNF
jgi:hypothetical protein